MSNYNNYKTMTTMKHHAPSSGENRDAASPATDISLHIAALQSTYQPASSPDEATHFFSTTEVIDAIRDIDPSAKVSPEQIFSALRQAGFSFCNRPGAHGLAFKWMFRERSF